MSAEKPKESGIIATIHSPDCDKHIAWIKSVFNAKQTEIYRSKDDEKTVMHCCLILNGGYLYICSNSLQNDSTTKEADKDESRGMALHVELEDPNPVWKNALNNGAMVIEQLKEQYWGGTYGSVRDPFGFVWGIMKGGECRKAGVIPYLIIEEGKCEAYTDWLVTVFEAKIKDKMMSETNLVQHCSVEINGGVMYMSDDVGMTAQKNELSGENANIVCHLCHPDPKAAWKRLTENGATSIMELEVQFWGDLFGMAKDSKGFIWSISEVTPPTSKVGGVVSYLLSSDCEKHIKWIENVMEGEVKKLMHAKDKKVMHCEMLVNGGTLMLSDGPCYEEGSCNKNDTSSTNESCEHKGFILHLQLSNPDKVWKRAMENGGVKVLELKEQFWGSYYGQFMDPFGYQWSVEKSEA